MKDKKVAGINFAGGMQIAGRCFCLSLFLLFVIASLLLLLSKNSLAEEGVIEELTRFRFIPEESQIKATIDDPFGSPVEGRFNLKSGQARAERERLQDTAHVEVMVDASSYDTDSEKRDKDVIQNYLEASRYPEITFNSTGFKNVMMENPKEGSLTVKGILQIHGFKKDVEIPVKITMLDDNKVVVEGTTRVKIKDFNIKRPVLMLFFRAGEEARIEFRLVAVREI